MKKKLPLYELQIDDNDIENSGLTAISLVSSPAIEIPFLMFNKQEKIEFSIASPERKIITGAVLIPNQVIYRRNPDGFEYQVKFSPDQVEKIVQRFHKTNNNNKVTLEHALSIQGADILNLFVSDSEMGISAPKGFESLPDKTLFASYKITDDILWNSIKEGVFKGFSLEGFFNMLPIQMKKEPTPLEIFNELNSLFSSL